MEMCYRSRGISKYVEVNIGDCNTLAGCGYLYQVRMLEDNKINNLIKPIVMEMDNNVYLKYEINSLYVLERYLREQKVNGHMLATWMKQLADCIFNMEKYLLLPDNIVLSCNYIFLDKETDELLIMYVPGYEKNIVEQIKAFLEYCMQAFDSSDRDGINLLYKIHARVSDGKCDVIELKNMVLQYENTFGLSENCYEVSGSCENIQDDFAQYTDINIHKSNERKNECKGDYKEDDKNEIKSEKKVKISLFRKLILGVNAVAFVYMLYMYFANRERVMALYAAILLLIVFVAHIVFCLIEPDEDIDEIMREYCEAELKDKYDEPKNNRLGNNASNKYISDASVQESYSINEYSAENSTSERNVVHRLVPLADGSLDDMDLTTAVMPCVIGRGKKETGYRIPTTQISRVHACIYSDEGFYYLEDRNSTNGTFINREKIEAFQRVKLNRGDIVSFAGEDFFVT